MIRKIYSSPIHYFVFLPFEKSRFLTCSFCFINWFTYSFHFSRTLIYNCLQMTIPQDVFFDSTIFSGLSVSLFTTEWRSWYFLVEFIFIEDAYSYREILSHIFAVGQWTTSPKGKRDGKMARNQYFVGCSLLHWVPFFYSSSRFFN